jgi:hypothetical protein
MSLCSYIVLCKQIKFNFSPGADGTTVQNIRRNGDLHVLCTGPLTASAAGVPTAQLVHAVSGHVCAVCAAVQVS